MIYGSTQWKTPVCKPKNIGGAKPMQTRCWFWLALVLSVLQWGCNQPPPNIPEGKEERPPERRVVPEPRPEPVAKDPTINLKPEINKVVAGQSLKLTVTVTNFVLKKVAKGSPNKEGEGRYRLYLNDRLPEGLLAEDTRTNTNVTFPGNLPAGNYTLIAVLTQHDGTPAVPYAEHTVEIEVLPVSGASLQAKADKTSFKAGETIKLTFTVSAFKLVPRPAKDATPKNGEGHINVYLPGKSGKEMLLSTHKTTASLTLPANFALGDIMLRVALVRSDDTALFPAVETSLKLTVQKPPPTVLVETRGKDVNAGDLLTLVVEVVSFKLFPVNSRPTNKPGQGHYQVFIDKVEAKNRLASSASRYVNMLIPREATAGKHTLYVVLVNNDGSPMTPTIQGTVEINILKAREPVFSFRPSRTSVQRGQSQTFSLTGLQYFRLSAIADNKAHVPGQGHYRLYWDNDPDDKPLLEDYRGTVSITIPRNATLGKHRVRILFMNNDKTVFKPRTEAWAEFQVIDVLPPTLQVAMTENHLTSGGKVDLRITVRNFSLRAISANPTPRNGQGHYRVYIDNNTGTNFVNQNYRTTTSFNLPTSLKEGRHTLKVVLVTNDKKPLKPSVDYSTEFFVVSSTKTWLTLQVDKLEAKAGERVIAAIRVGNFKLIPYQPGSKHKAGEGFVRVRLNGSTVANTVNPTVAIRIPGSAKVGTQELTVELRQNDGKRVNPAITDKLTIKILPANAIAQCSTTFQSNVGCTTWTDLTAASAKREVTFGGTLGNAYSPKCLRVKAGQSVVFRGSFSAHPLEQVCGVARVMTPVSSGGTSTVTFKTAGYYGYRCIRHSTPVGDRMSGAIQVVP
jgi:plastocyanin